MGHSSCGGIKGGYDLCQNGNGSAIAAQIHPQMGQNGEPAFDRLDKPSLKISKSPIWKNVDHGFDGKLMSFPFIQDAVEENRLSLHALWHDIGRKLHEFNPEKEEFTPLKDQLAAPSLRIIEKHQKSP